MQIKLIELSSNASETEIEQVNRFLRSNKILSIDREFYTHMGEAKWTMLVVYQPKNDITINRDEKREKVDYKEILDEDAFEIYVQLKLIRKQLAEENALPLFAVFSNYELSQIAQLEEINEQTVCSISGIGAVAGTTTRGTVASRIATTTRLTTATTTSACASWPLSLELMRWMPDF